MIKGDLMETFGCGRCWPASADDAWAAKRSSEIKTSLIDDSHYIVSIWICPTCAQHFLSITTEMVDWDAGEDPIYRTFMPITQSELATLMERGPPTEAALNAVGPGRRCLKYDHPKDHPPSVYWSSGVLVGAHD